MFKLDPEKEPIDFPSEAYGAFLAENYEPLKDINLDPVFHLINMVKIMNRGVDEFCKKLKITRHQWQILVYLNYKQKSGGAAPAELAALSKLTRASITRHVDELELQGWVVRGPNPKDGRGFQIFLSPEAFEKLQTIIPTHYTLLANIMRDFRPSEKDELIRLLTKIRRNFGPQNEAVDYDMDL